MRELKRFFSYIGEYKVPYWTILIMTLLTSAMLNLTYSYMNKLVFNAIEYRNQELFKRAVIVCVILVVLYCLAPYRRYFQIRIVRKLVFDIKIRLFEKLMKMELDYYEKNHSGEALKVLNSDANSLKDSYFAYIFWVSNRLVSGVISIFAMLIYSPLLMLVSVSFCLVTVFISVQINKQIKNMDKEIQNKISRLTSQLSDILSGFTELKMYSGASIVYNNYHEENGKVLKDEKDRADKAAVLEMVAFFLGILASFGTIGVGAYMVACGLLDYGTVMAIVSLQMAVSTMVQSFGSALTDFSASLVKADKVFDFLELECEEDQNDSTIELKQGVNPIEVDNLTFSYDEHKYIFKNFTLRHLHITEFQHFRLYLNAPAKHFIKKALNKYRRILQYAWCCNKGTFSLNSFQMSILHHPQHCRTHCGTTDTKLFTKLHFFRNFITDRPFSRMNLVHDIFFNL